MCKQWDKVVFVCVRVCVYIYIYIYITTVAGYKKQKSYIIVY